MTASPRISCRWEKLGALLAEPNVRDLIQSYNDELNPLPEVAAMDPDWAEFQRREDAGIYRIWACRVDRTLAGFVSFHVFPHLQCRSSLWAYDAGSFLHPAFRDKGRVGYRMWRNVEPALAALGVQVIMAHDNALRPLLPFFLALGYEPRSVTFTKVIGQ